MVDMFRAQDTEQDYKKMSTEIYNFLKKYSFPRTRIEINAHDSVYSFLKEMGTPKLEQFRTTSKSKNQIITYLVSQMSNNSIKLLDDFEIKNEMTNFGYTINKNNGNVQYAGLNNNHDDIVMSIAIAISHFAGQNTKPLQFFSIR